MAIVELWLCALALLVGFKLYRLIVERIRELRSFELQHARVSQ